MKLLIMSEPTSGGFLKLYVEGAEIVRGYFNGAMQILVCLMLVATRPPQTGYQLRGRS